MSSVKFSTPQQGFSLIEMAIVLVILGMLLGGMLMPLSSQREVSQRQATERQLQEIRNALIGFAQANNRLPCPAILGNGAAAPAVGACPDPVATGATYVPFAALGVQGTIINGNLVDVWQQPIRYRLANPAPGAWVYANSPIPSALATTTVLLPYFRICSDINPCPSPAPTLIAGSVVAVVFSTGNNDHADSAGELQNQSLASNDFVQRTLEQNFNDIVVWISQPTLIYELSKSSQ
jgi:prepilin-type N-terminal cleavage/methylation domain-containing protein